MPHGKANSPASTADSRKRNRYWTKWRAHLKAAYGLSEADYIRLMEEQSGTCAVCRTRPEKGLVVDHDHKTGKVRGLLCNNCDILLGMVHEDSTTLRFMILYLQRHQ